MWRRNVLGIVVIVAFLVSGSALAQVDYFYYPGGANWVVAEGVWSGDYGSLTARADLSLYYFGVNTGGGLDYLYYDGNWQVIENYIPSNNYVSVAGDDTDYNWMTAAKAGGGVDVWYYGGGASWTHVPDKFGGSYTSIAAREGTFTSIFAAKAGGGVDLLNWYDGTTANIVDGTYMSLTGDGFNPNVFYGTKANGGIDMVRLEGSTWQTYSDIWDSGADTYLSLASREGLENYLWGAKAGGGIDFLYYASGQWSKISDYFDGEYNALVGDGSSYDIFMGNVVPEPASVILLGIGGLLLAKRRK